MAICLFQGITTKYIGPSNMRGSRVKARSAGGHSLTLHWDHSLNAEENHAAVAAALARKLGWAGKWRGGSTDSGFAFVCDGDAFEIPHSDGMGATPLAG